MKNKSIQFLEDYANFKSALLELGLSGQQIKKHLSSSQKNIPIKNWEKYEVATSLLSHNQINPSYFAPNASHQISIIKENENYLAIEKPHRVHSFPLSYVETDNALSFIRQEGLGALFSAYTEFLDRNLLFRLDYETAGVLLFAKNHRDLKKLRREMGHKKIYAIILDGHFSMLGELSNYYRSVGKKGERVECLNHEVSGSRIGHMEILATEYDKTSDKTLVIVQLISGVRHQLRSFFSSQGFPILGDNLYGGLKSKNLCLHACFYKVENFFAFSSPLFLRDFLNLNSRFQMLCDQLAIG